MKTLFLLPAILLFATAAIAKSTRPEIGAVDWKRDFDAALKESASSGKPVFAFFQEVPG